MPVPSKRIQRVVIDSTFQRFVTYFFARLAYKDSGRPFPNRFDPGNAPLTVKTVASRVVPDLG
jgi:hypothetical protein